VICSKELQVMRLTNDWIDAAGSYAAGSHRFPRYLIGPESQLRDVYTLAYRDFWNSIGIDGRTDEFLLDSQLPAG
jgi:hypothetical protein